MNKLQKSYLTVLLLVGSWICGIAHAWENKSKPWQRLENCHLVESIGNDGDSFHVKHGKKEYVFRLCYVDCPETSLSYPARVREQGEWWGISDEDVVKAGLDAEVFTMKLLRGKSFTVYTKMTDARGRSKLGREFAMIKVGGKWLCELLAENGLARSYGYTVATPDGVPRRDFRKRIDSLEARAKAAGLGAWKYAEGNVRGNFSGGTGNLESYDVTLKQPLWLYAGSDPNAKIARLPAGTKVRVMPGGGHWRVNVSVQLTGQCERTAVESLR